MNSLESFTKPQQYWDDESYNDNNDDDHDVDEDDVLMSRSEELHRPRWS